MRKFKRKPRPSARPTKVTLIISGGNVFAFDAAGELMKYIELDIVGQRKARR